MTLRLCHTGRAITGKNNGKKSSKMVSLSMRCCIMKVVFWFASVSKDIFFCYKNNNANFFFNPTES